MHELEPRRTEFSNGAVLLTASRPYERDVVIDLWIPYGQIHEVPEAHFLEHMAFKSNKFRSAERIAYDTEGRGIKYRAATYADKMNFYMLSPAEHVKTALKILYECFVNYQFVPEEVDLEKGVVIGDLLQRKSTPYYSIRRKVENRAFENHPLEITEETEESIQAVTPQKLNKSKQRFFGPYNLCLGIVGNINQDEIIQLTNETFGRLNRTGNEKVNFPYKDRTYWEELEEKYIDTGAVFIGFPVVGLDHPDTYALHFISYLLGRDGYLFSGRLHQELRRKRGLVYAADSNYERYSGVGLFLLGSVGINKGNIRTVRELLIEQLERLKQEEISEEELERVKTAALVQEYRNNHKGISGIAEWLALTELYEIPWKLEHYEEQISSLTQQRIREVTNRYFDGKYVIGEVIPKD